MKKNTLKAILISIANCLLLTANCFSQCMMREIPLEQRVIESNLVVEGKVLSKQSYWDAGHKMIYTSNTIEVYKIFKGSLSASTIELLTEGGTVGNYLQKFDPSLNLEIDEVGIFTCIPPVRYNISPNHPVSALKFEAYASAQGFIQYNQTDISAFDAFRTYPSITGLYNRVLQTSNVSKWSDVKFFDANSLAGNGADEPLFLAVVADRVPRGVDPAVQRGV